MSLALKQNRIVEQRRATGTAAGMHRCLCLFSLPLLLLAVGCSEAPLGRTDDGDARQLRRHQLTKKIVDSDRELPAKIETLHLPNVVVVHPNVISGGLPESDLAFQELRSLGVKTVISVDGMKPDTLAAKKCGLRYVHLPHGYNGVPPQRIAELAKAVSTLDGPIYIHCHHGKHRSPAAASVACFAAGLIPKPNRARCSPVSRYEYQLPWTLRLCRKRESTRC